MKRDASGITGRPRRRVRFWSANACMRGGRNSQFLGVFEGFCFFITWGTKKIYIKRLTFE